MADADYATGITRTPGGNELRVNPTTGTITNAGTQASHIADQKTDYEAGNLDLEAEIIAAFNATNTALNAVLAALEGVGVLASS
jgi:hypothetical protein